MNGSIKIGNAFGIPVRIHLTFLLLVYALSLFSENALLTLGFIGLCFGCVLLHELGHSLVARGFGLHVADITLWPLGGIARMSRIPENSRIEALIAVAGPAVNFALAGVALILMLTGHAFGLPEHSGFAMFLKYFLLINVLQGGFNLLPAFPMDGGRLLRAFLGRKRNWLNATEIAVRVGRIVAVLFLAASIWLMLVSPWNACVLPLLAFFIWFEGTRELWSVRIRHGVTPFSSAFGINFGKAQPRDASATSASTDPRPDDPSEPGDARRPSTWQQGALGHDGFSEDEIRRLESHRGPLRRPPDEP